MRVGIVTPRYPPNASGGGEVSVRLLAEHLTDRVDTVTVLSFDGQGEEQHNGVEVRRLARLSPTVTELQNLRAAFSLYDVLDDFDVVHAYNMELNPVVGGLAGRGTPATVATLNSYHYFPKSAVNSTPRPIERVYERFGHPTTGRILEWLSKRIDAFIALSTAVRDVYLEHGYDTDRIDVVPNMIDPSFTVEPEGTGDADGTGTTVLYVGEIDERKGVEYLVRAAEHLPDSFDLRIVGDGPQLEELRNLTASLGLSDRITFTGWVPYDQIPSQYARADVFVHPGLWPEPFGRTILESMQAELPVVCTEVGGPADIVRQSELRCPPGDPVALADAVRTATERADTLGVENRQYVESEYAPETVVSRVLDVYDRVSKNTPVKTAATTPGDSEKT